MEVIKSSIFVLALGLMIAMGLIIAANFGKFWIHFHLYLTLFGC